MVETFEFLRTSFWCQKSEVESRTQGSRPRTQKNPRPSTALPRPNPLEAKDQEHKRKCSSKKRSSEKFFRRSSKKRRKKAFIKIFQANARKKSFPKKFSGAPQTFNNSKNSAVLEPSTGQFSRT